MGTYEQEDLFSISENKASSATPSAKDAFGCCSRYSACSDARVCLIPDRDYAKNCNYRKSLERGRIFYGKNADNFHADVYQSLVDNYNVLSAGAAELLRGIFYYAFITKRCIRTITLADSPEIPVLERAGFLSQVKRPDIVVSTFTMSALVNACGDLIVAANEWAKSEWVKNEHDPDDWKKRKNVSQEFPGIKISREELSDWMKQFSPEDFQLLSNGNSNGAKKAKTPSLSDMITACGSLIETANEWAKSRVNPNEWKERKNARKTLPGIKILRDELSTWIIRCSPEARKKVSEGISFVQLDLNKILELEEFFKDCIYTEGLSFPLDTLENDPRFLRQ